MILCTTLVVHSPANQSFVNVTFLCVAISLRNTVAIALPHHRRTSFFFNSRANPNHVHQLSTSLTQRWRKNENELQIYWCERRLMRPCHICSAQNLRAIILMAHVSEITPEITTLWGVIYCPECTTVISGGVPLVPY